jgi:hypothetical protein
MNTFYSIIIIGLLLLLNHPGIMASADTVRYDPETDPAQNYLAASKHSVYSVAGYGNFLVYPESSLPQNQTFGYAALMYDFNNELFAAVSTFDLINSTTIPDFYSYSVNYTHNINKWLDISLTVARFRFNKSSSFSLLNDLTYADITTGINWKLFYTNISCSGIFTEQSQYYFQLKNSRYFQTPAIFKGNAFLYFNPYVNFLFGSYLSAPSTTDSGSGVASPSKIFGPMEIDLGLPVAIKFDKLTIEAEAGYIIPSTSDSSMPRPQGFVFMISGSLRIFRSHPR